MPRGQAIQDVSELSREERDIAKRWCILNCWGWPPDLPMPASLAERKLEGRRLMAKCERQMSKSKILLYWNSDEFQRQSSSIKQVCR
jgi:hypothetical protein